MMFAQVVGKRALTHWVTCEQEPLLILEPRCEGKVAGQMIDDVIFPSIDGKREDMSIAQTVRGVGSPDRRQKFGAIVEASVRYDQELAIPGDYRTGVVAILWEEPVKCAAERRLPTRLDSLSMRPIRSLGLQHLTTQRGRKGPPIKFMQTADGRH